MSADVLILSVDTFTQIYYNLLESTDSVILALRDKQYQNLVIDGGELNLIKCVNAKYKWIVSFDENPLQNRECEVKADTDLECYICTNKYDTAEKVGIRLSCGHQFCKECIKAFNCSTIKCPMCRQEYELRYTTIYITRARVNRFIYWIRVFLERSCLICIDDPHCMELISYELIRRKKITLLNKPIISYADIKTFETGDTEILIIPYGVIILI